MQSDLRIMRNSSGNNTPKATAVQDESVSNSAEKANAKKLRQARLPFKIITPIAGSKTATTPAVVDQDQDAIKESSMDSKKRKLSNTADECANIDKEEAHHTISKENVKLLTATSKKKKLSAVSNNGTTSEPIISLVDDDYDNNENTSNDDVINSSSACKINENIKASDSTVTVKNKQKGAGTPLNDKSSNVTKLQIKLPLSSGKKKRRKSKLLHLTQKRASDNLANELSSDDIEGVSVELNPQKRKKLSTENYGTNIPNMNDLEENQKMRTVDLCSEPEQEEKGKISTSALIANNKLKNVEIGKDKQPKKETDLKSTFEHDSVKTTQISTLSGDSEKQNEEKEDMEECAASDNEADDETDNLGEKPISNSSDVIENAKFDFQSETGTTKSLKEEKNATSSMKNVTPKQMKLMEQRRKAREEKERKLQEEKTKKQQEKEEKETAKKREREEREEQKRKEREEKEEQRRKEREEKEEQRRKEREEKERKRLAEIEAKNEEKRKKNEAKEEELRRKEEERKRKEQEKEEAELKKKKAAQAFTKFFVAKTPTTVQIKNDDDSNTGDGNKLLAFRPFQIKGDMKLAPICRKILTVEEKIRLDDLLCTNKTGARKNNDADNIDALPKSQLYISELLSGKILPGKWRRHSIESKDDVILIDDELERVGQEIVEDTPAYVREEMRVKFYKFHDNRRPPYYGTWRKKSSVVKPRKPFAQDMKFFDYEMDSDDEWEEEEPGESLEDGSDEDKEKESEDDDYEVDNEWFVPHGHLSDEELQNEDEFGMGDDNTREAQKVKLQLLQQEFAQEMKKKTEKIKPRLIGCIWADKNGNQPPECAKILWETLEKKSMLFMDHPLIEEPEFEKSNELNSPSSTTNSNVEKVADKLKPIKLSDNMVKDLTRLVHGNNHAKNFLINEYIAYVEKTEDSVKNGGLRKPLKSVVRDKIDEIAEWQSVEASASHLKEMETNDKKKKKVKRRLCWVVKQEILDKMDLSLLELKNCWKYTLKPKFIKAENNLKINETTGELTNEGVRPATEDGEKVKNSEITKFAKVLTAEGKATKLKKTSRSTDKSSTEANSNSPATPKEKKRVPLLMSVARGQQISTPAKNKLISQFLQQSNKETTTTSPSSSRSKTVTSPNIEDDVVILD